MVEVKFYDTVEDSLLKFAVIIAEQKENGFSANTKTGILWKYREVTEKPEKRSWRRRNVN